MNKITQKRSLFWDVAGVDLSQNRGFVIERILQFGDEADFKWAKDFYGKEGIKNQFLKAKNLDKKSQSFWCKYFNV